MADLKSGSTVGGSPIWTQGNLNIQPAGEQLFYKGHKIFTAFDQPTATEFDAVSASKGGTFEKQVHFEEGLSVGSASAGETKKNGIFKGAGDAATFDGVSWGLHSWYSIGFVNARDNTINALIDTTTGDFKTKGSLQGVEVLDTGERVYSPVNKPSNDDLDLMSRHGDVVSGTYTFNSSKINFSLDSTLLIVDGRETYSLFSFDKNNINVGDIEKTFNILSQNEPVLMIGGQVSNFYHTNNKPSKNDVGLGNVTNDAQVKREGDVIEGTITAPKLLVTTDPETPNELIRLSYFERKAMTANMTVITAESDWDMIKDRGIYKVENAGGSLHSPESNHYNGVLMVYKPDETKGVIRIVQVYYPESIEHPLSWRSFADNVWSGWNYVDHRGLSDKRYVNVSGDVMDGSLTVPMDKGVKTAESLYNGDNYYGALGSSGGSVMVHRVSDNKAEEMFGITHDSKLVFVQALEETQSSETRMVYHEGHKPTASDVGAVPLNAVIDFGTF